MVLFIRGVICWWYYLLVVLFVTATISQSAVLREKRGQIYLATAKPCTAQHRTAAQLNSTEQLHSWTAQQSCTADISCHSSCIEAAREMCIDANAVGFKMLCRCRRAAAFKSALFKFLLCAMMNGTSWSMRSCSALDALLHCLTIAPLNYCNVILWPKNLYSGE